MMLIVACSVSARERSLDGGTLLGWVSYRILVAMNAHCYRELQSKLSRFNDRGGNLREFRPVALYLRGRVAVCRCGVWSLLRNSEPTAERSNHS
jgi:hypothetical protein